MSLVSYNGVYLPYANNTSFSQTALRDNESDTDWYLTKFDISVQCIISSEYLAYLAPDIDGSTSNPADVMDVIRSRLLVHRKQLSFKCNGVDLIPQKADVEGNVDAQNGPKPQSCTIIGITNTTFLLTYRITACYWENNEIDQGGQSDSPDELVINKPGNVVLYNRWSEMVEINNLNQTTRTREGVFVIRSDNQQGRIVDQMRTQMAVTSVPSGFLRKSTRYRVDPSGLKMAYTLIDEEVYRMPPSPAFEADGEYYESAIKAMGCVLIGECRVALKGDNSTSQSTLITTALNMAINKMMQRGNQFQGGGGVGWLTLENASVRTKLFRNEVEVTIRMMTTATQTRFLPTATVGTAGGGIATFGAGSSNGLAAFVGLNPSVPGSTLLYTPKYLDRGTANFLLQAAAYYDPSLKNTILGAGEIYAQDVGARTSTDNRKIQLTQGVQPGQAGLRGED